MAGKTKKLDARERRFVSEYLVDLDPKRAAIAAGYSESMAESKAYQWVSGSKSTKPHVQAAVWAGQKKREERTGITGDEVVQELGILGLSDIGKVLSQSECGRYLTIRSLDDLDPKARRMIKSIKQTTHEYTEGHGDEARAMEKVVLQVELHPKVAALDLLLAHFGLKVHKHELTGKDGGPIETQETKVRYVMKLPPEEPEE